MACHAPHEQQVLVHAMAVDADPFPSGGDEENTHVRQRHLVLELVHEARHLLRNLLLDVPPTRFRV